MEEDALCSINRFKQETKSVNVPSKFNTVEEAMQNMQDVLLFEANESMKRSIDPPLNPHLHAVNIESNPGLVTCNRFNKINILDAQNAGVASYDCVGNRKKSSFEKFKCELNYNAAPDRSEIENKKLKNEEKYKKDTKAKCEKLDRSEEREKSRAEKKQQKEDEKRKVENMTKEEKLEYKQRKNEEKEERRQKREENKKSNKPVKSQNENKTDKVKKNETVDEEITNSHIVVNNSINKKDLLFYPSPIPYDRHLRALEFTNPNTEFRNALLLGSPTDNLNIIHGPPGTGKTYTLIEKLKLYLTNYEGRAVIVSPTNVGAANIYTRCNEAGISCAISLSKNKIPIDMPTFKHYDNITGARVVCCTVAGRNNSELKYMPFSGVFIDEAGMIPESHCWGLFREEVEYVVMAGDTNQLPGMVSQQGKLLQYDRSLMERLQLLNFPVDFLNTQRRMHPEILKFPNSMFYDNRLKSDYCGIDDSPYLMYHVDGKEVEHNSSFYNIEEINLISQLLPNLKNVVVITPYVSQNYMINKYGIDCVLHTIDSFQGRESDTVILSMVRTEKPGFWNDARRLLVALTRARHKLIIICNTKSYAFSESILFNLKEDALHRGLVNFH